MGQQGERESSRSLGPNTPDQGNSKIGVGVRGRAGRARCGMREVARSQPPRALRVMGSPWDFTPRERMLEGSMYVASGPRWLLCGNRVRGSRGSRKND